MGIKNLLQTCKVSFSKMKNIFQWLINLIKILFYQAKFIKLSLNILSFFETPWFSSAVCFTLLNFVFNYNYIVNQETQVTWKGIYDFQALFFFNSTTVLDWLIKRLHTKIAYKGLWNYHDEFGSTIIYPVDFNLMKKNFKVYVSYCILYLSLFNVLLVWVLTIILHTKWLGSLIKSKTWNMSVMF